jgi:hypothetical protein
MHSLQALPRRVTLRYALWRATPAGLPRRAEDAARAMGQARSPGVFPFLIPLLYKFLYFVPDECEQLEHLLHSGRRRPAQGPVLVCASKRPRAGRIAPSLPPSLWGVLRLHTSASASLQRGWRRWRHGPPRHPAQAGCAGISPCDCRSLECRPRRRQPWPFPLLAERLVVLGLAPSYAYERVRRVFPQRSASRGGSSTGASQRAVRSAAPLGKTSWRSTPSRRIPHGAIMPRRWYPRRSHAQASKRGLETPAQHGASAY